VTKDYNVIGMHGFVNALRKCSNREPIILGKRGSYFECLMKHSFKLGKPCRVLFISDNLETDIRCGIEAGFQTLLLTEDPDIESTLKKSPTVPDFYVTSLFEFIDLLHEIKTYIFKKIKQ